MPAQNPPVPHPDSYWVIPGKLLAGDYPGHPYDENFTRRKLQALLNAGVNTWLDLTEKGELTPYEPILAEEAGWLERQVTHWRVPIRDFGTPPARTMQNLLNRLDTLLDDGAVVYVHCYGGIGRTGTVVGCYLVRHGLTGEQALLRLADLRKNVPDAWRDSPESDAQREMVLNWATND